MVAEALLGTCGSENMKVLCCVLTKLTTGFGEKGPCPFTPEYILPVCLGGVILQIPALVSVLP